MWRSPPPFVIRCHGRSFSFSLPIPAMSTFSGLIREYPSIRVDNFKDNCIAYFLSHCHTDHLVGLARRDFPGPIYCSLETARALVGKTVGKSSNRPYARYRDILRILPLGVAVRLAILPDESFTVTMLDAQHCPGSAMFLFEGSSGRVLYTGDCRMERSGNLSLGRVDHLYLDNTLLKPAFHTLPSRQESLLAVGKVVCWLKRQSPKAHIIVVSASLGFEGVVLAAARAAQRKVYVSERKLRFYSKTFKDAVGLLTADKAATNLHACEGCDLCVEALSENRAYRIIAGVRSWEADLRSGKIGYRDLKKTVETLPRIVKVVGKDIHVLFGMHSSVVELKRLVEDVAPAELSYCVGRPEERLRNYLES